MCGFNQCIIWGQNEHVKEFHRQVCKSWGTNMRKGDGAKLFTTLESFVNRTQDFTGAAVAA